MMTPAPKKPTPAKTPCTTRLTASTGTFPTTSKPMAVSVAKAEPSATRPSMRTPAGLPCRSRLMPITAPTLAAASRRKVISNNWSVGMPIVSRLG